MLACSNQNPASRKQQLETWESSDTNKEVVISRSADRVKFPIDVQFFAACSSSEMDEIKELLSKGVDINVVNADGLTVLHQACIDNDYNLAKFLIEHKANVNAQDNEGWTPLHACASCSYTELAKLLLDNGADVSVVSFEMELPIDVAQGGDMISFLREAMDKKGVDAANARRSEELLMLEDVNSWLKSGKYPTVIDPRTGATALHVAAAKGYASVLELLLKLPGIDVDAADNDGWTPLHAAAHWAKDQPLRLLSSAGAAFDKITNTNQSIFDVTDSSMTMLIRQLREHQRIERQQAEERAAAMALCNKPATPAPEENKAVQPSVAKKKREGDEEGSSEKTEPAKPEERPTEKPSVPTPSTVSEPPSMKNEEKPADATVPRPVLSKHEPMKPTAAVKAPEPKPEKAEEPRPPSEEAKKPAETPAFVTQPTQPTRRVSAVLAPSKSEETEAQRSSKARLVRSIRRSTQGITNDVFEEAKRLSAAMLQQPLTTTSTNTTTTTATSEAQRQKTSTEASQTPIAPPAKSEKPSTLVSTPSLSDSDMPPHSVEITDPLSAVPKTIPFKSTPPTTTATTTPANTTAASTITTTASSTFSSSALTSKLADAGPPPPTALLNSRSDDTETATPTQSSYRSRRTARDRVPTGKLSSADVIAAASQVASKSTVLNNNHEGSDESSPIPRPTTRLLRNATLDTTGSNGDRPSSSPARQSPSISSGISSCSTSRANAVTKPSDRVNWHETIDYRRLYEEERTEKERLRRVLNQVNLEVAMLRSEIPRLQSSATGSFRSSSSTSNLKSLHSGGDVSGGIARDMSPASEINRLRQENAKMADENKSLIRVISKLSNRS